MCACVFDFFGFKEVNRIRLIIKFIKHYRHLSRCGFLFFTYFICLLFNNLMNIHKSATQTRNENIINNILLLMSSSISFSVFPLQVSIALNFVFDIALKKVCMYVCTHTYMSTYTYMFVYVYSLATHSDIAHIYIPKIFCCVLLILNFIKMKS